VKDAYTNTVFKKLVLDEVRSVCDHHKLSSLEKPKKVFLSREPFSIENNLLTPTMKLKRNIAKVYFWPQIKALYE
jgi:long-chain acyl-CoA synthetase